jgi:hypothetical protein
MCGEVYGIAESISSIIVREFCSTIKKHLKPFMILKLTRNKIKENFTLVLKACREFHTF